MVNLTGQLQLDITDQHAIKLHRQPLSREVGLQIFEKLLALNLRETRSALEMLDRRPTRPGYYVAPRRRLRKRHLPSS